MAALKYWVWLTTLPGLTDSSKMLLMEHFSSPEDIYYADEEALWQVDGLKKEQAALLGSKSLAAADRILSDCARKDIFIITMADALYPDRLRNIYQPPLLLYGKGAMPLFDEEAAVAVVGTRSCTPYGIKCAEKLGYELTQQGGMVVSGMAKGVDGAAMRGALRFGGFTCGVLGGGVDVVYPAENRRLYEDIAATGVLLSEYPPQTLPEAWHFPVRNRIISGLSVAAVVVEAPVKSGALITAENAMEQGRDVFAIPGPVDAPNSAGCHRLIREGAILATCAWDILGEYESRFPHKLRRAAYAAAAPPGGRAQAGGGKTENQRIPAGGGRSTGPALPDGGGTGRTVGRAAHGAARPAHRRAAADRPTGRGQRPAHPAGAAGVDAAGDQRLGGPERRAELRAHGGAAGRVRRKQRGS